MEEAKVSMVMPCYNKAAYIGRMFDTILAQTYDNIELILVNDGSTDGTRDIIRDYADKFRDRGFEVVIIDQPNKGMCGAVKTGLSRFTGDFVCVVDADDSLHPDYCKAAVDIMIADESVDYTVCGYNFMDINSDYSSVNPPSDVLPPEACTDSWVNYISDKVNRAAWARVIRRECFDAVKIKELIYDHPTASAELFITIPLILSTRKSVFINRVLYYRIIVPNGHSSVNDLQNLIRFSDDHLRETLGLIKKIVIDPETFDRYKREYEVYEISYTLPYILFADAADDIKIRYVKRAVKTFSAQFGFLLSEYIIKTHPDIFRRIVYSMLSNDNVDKNFPSGRTIGYGVLGKRGRRFVTLFREGGIPFHELWDNNADGSDSLYDLRVKKPEPETLTKNDIVFVFPLANQDIVSSLSPFGCSIITGPDIEEFFISSFISANRISG